MDDTKQIRVYVTGTRGAGKTTTIAYLTKQLQAAGFDVEFIDHPGYNAPQLESMLLDPEWLDRNLKKVVEQLKGKLIISEGMPLQHIPTAERSEATDVFNSFLTEEIPEHANNLTVVAGKLMLQVPSFMDSGVVEFELYRNYSKKDARSFMDELELPKKNASVTLIHGLIWLSDGSYLQYHRTNSPQWHLVGPVPPIPTKP